MNPIFGSPFLGAGAEWLHLLSPDLVVPPVSWMGGKRRLAREVLALLDLHPGRPVPCILGDASWWGWVWPTCLDPVTGPEVSAMLRFWRGRDPRALWFWLRDVGPMESRVEAAAQLLWLQARAASGVPVWWEGAEVLAAPGPGRERQPAADRGANGLRAQSGPRADGTRGTCIASMCGASALVQHASTKVDAAGQRQATELRLVATTHGNGQPPGVPYDAGCKGSLMASDGRGVPREAGHKQMRSEGGKSGGIVDPGTIATRLDAIRAACAKGTNAAGAGGIVDPGTRVFHTDALTLVTEWAPRLGAAGRWYLDPPYQGATGYPATCPREEVLVIAETAARYGGRVVLSEAVGLAAELGRGWSQVQLRDGKRPEWVTLYGCDARAHLPPILRACG